MGELEGDATNQNKLSLSPDSFELVICIKSAICWRSDIGVDVLGRPEASERFVLGGGGMLVVGLIKY